MKKIFSVLLSVMLLTVAEGLFCDSQPANIQGDAQSGFYIMSYNGKGQAPTRVALTYDSTTNTYTGNNGKTYTKSTGRPRRSYSRSNTLPRTASSNSSSTTTRSATR